MKNLQTQINELNAKREAIKAANTGKNDFPVIKRTFTYRKSPAIKAVDVCAL